MSVSTKRHSEDPVVAIEDHFAGLGAHYDERAFGTAGHQWVSERELDAVRAALRGMPAGARVLDAGCGNGRITSVLADELGFAVTALDPIPDMLAATKQRSPTVSTLLARLGEPIPLSSSAFDAVVAMRVLKWVPAWELAIEELARVLAPGGRCVLEITNRRSIARLGYRGAPIALCSAPEVRRVAREFGVDLTDVYAGTHLPYPFWSAARTNAKLRACTTLQHGCDAVLGTAGARSLVLAGHKRVWP
jgi:ubiquinone/menaquinone biosynthesis C-methylase UbiE